MGDPNALNFEPPLDVKRLEQSEAVERLERLDGDSFSVSVAIERLELTEIYRSNAERKAFLILFRLSVEREPSFLWRRIAGIDPIP